MPGLDEFAWWQKRTMYEIYVPSFADSNDDGWGDLDGVTSKLDYLTDLGVGILWLPPFFRSPFVDCGYDVSDYRDVDPRFGTLASFDRLLAETHRRDLKLLIDLVPNHTSDQHPWFQKSRASRDNPYRDWYWWRDARPDGGPPNNWIDRFGESGWTWDETTEQYFLRSFTPEQPDLNWRNPKVREAMFDNLRFWLDRGVDGVRIDAPAYMGKDANLRDDPPNPAYTEDMEPNMKQTPYYSQDGNFVFEILKEMRAVVDEYEGERILYAEGYVEVPRIYDYCQAGVHLMLNAFLQRTPYEAVPLRHHVDAIERFLGLDWPNWAAGNHDLHRLASRIGERGLRIAALIQLTLRGTPTIYYGDEIGMKDGDVPHSKMCDPSGIKRPRYSRDNYRTPMQWTAEKNAGFSTKEPWLPVAKGYRNTNVAAQQDDPDSLLDFYKRLLAVRNREPALQTSLYRPIAAPENLWVFQREKEGDRFLIAANFDSRKKHEFDVSNFIPNPVGEIVLSTLRRNEGEPFDRTLKLAKEEGVLIRLKPA